MSQHKNGLRIKFLNLNTYRFSKSSIDMSLRCMKFTLERKSKQTPPYVFPSALLNALSRSIFSYPGICTSLLLITKLCNVSFIARISIGLVASKSRSSSISITRLLTLSTASLSLREVGIAD